MPNILVVDDENSIRESFSLILEGQYKVLLAASGEAALKIITDQKVDLAFLDFRMPGLNGLETLKKIKRLDPNIEVIMITAVNDVQKAGETIKQGARDYIVKPFDVEHVLKLAQQTLGKKSITAEGEAIQQKLRKKNRPLIGQSDAINEIRKKIDRLKNSERVLIGGEIGTEKELVAQLIHDQSSRSHQPFRAVTLSNEMSAAQINALFFGWGKGASTVDLLAQSGVFEEAREGTVFINNLEALPPETFKTIFALEFSRAGSGGMTKIAIESRLISGVNSGREAGQAMTAFFSQVQFSLPSLRDRGPDILLLINHFLEKYKLQYNKEVKLTPAAQEALLNYSWPGNIAQLDGLLESLVLLKEGEVLPQDLPLDLLLNTTSTTGSEVLPLFEKKYIQTVLAQKGKQKAAAFLGINPFLLEAKL